MLATAFVYPVYFNLQKSIEGWQSPYKVSTDDSHGAGAAAPRGTCPRPPVPAPRNPLPLQTIVRVWAHPC